MASPQSHRPDARPSSPSISNSPSATDQDFSLSASSKTTQPPLKLFKDYVRKYRDRFGFNGSLERNRLVASSEKENYEKQISKLKAIHTNIAGLLAREQSANNELRHKLDAATNCVARLSKVVADANFVFIRRKQTPHEINQEEPSQESMNVPNTMLCSNAGISSPLSEMGAIVTEMNAHCGVGQVSPVDPSPCHSITEVLSKVTNSLLATQRSFGLLLEDLKSVDTSRVEIEFQNKTLQEKIALLQEELKEKRRDNERISQELAQARLERENHICRTPASANQTPAVCDDFHGSLPSPPLEGRYLHTSDGQLPLPSGLLRYVYPGLDILQDGCEITRKANPAPMERVVLGNAITPPPAPTVKTGPPSRLASKSGGRRKTSVNEFAERLKVKSASSITQSGPLKPPTVQDDKQAAGPSMPLPTTPAQGMKRTSGDAYKCQDSGTRSVGYLTPPVLKNIDSVASPLDAERSISPEHGLYIPQRRYAKGSGRDRPENQGLILFLRQDGSHFPLSAALLGDYSSLVLRDLPVPGGYTLTLRVEWPGYPPRDFQLRCRDWCHTPNRIPASKLGTEVAKAIRTFIQKMQNETINPEHAEWKVGPSGIKVEDLRIASLEQVSAGSWQARLFYKPS